MNRALWIILITSGLAAAGALMGAFAGILALAIGVAITEGPSALAIAGTFWFPALWGGLFGGIGGPLAAWLLMRRVPLGRALAGSILGAVIGGVLGWTIPIAADEAHRAIVGAVIGYVLAVVCLRIWGQSLTPRETDAAV